ncbi:MAG: lipoyl synthase [Candidatus Melainabacteria bacterium RIFCSPHIGHO2_02_FULL_34_12]|nr:MAG: lipoyl synthase [Candidatus Melainabacteria bacterium RIFCSPHIGHO2_02_FULL_34_12]
MSSITKERKRLPDWLKKDVLLNTESRKVHALIQEFNLNTVCKSARCPNRNECFSSGTATFMILGNTCTRGCTFCSVPKGRPELTAESWELREEPKNVARAAKIMGLNHVVITSVNRDDLNDQGSNHFSRTISELRTEIPNVTIEVLTPDFRGDKKCIETVVNAKPDIYNHNLETVPRLYREVRPGAIYTRSLELIKYVKNLNPKIITKSGIMLGLGERKEEIIQVLNNLFLYDCDYVTLGQYMQPTRSSYPVHRYLLPEEFEELKEIGLRIGFKKVFSGALVRSSYHAKELHEE